MDLFARDEPPFIWLNLYNDAYEEYGFVAS